MATEPKTRKRGRPRGSKNGTGPKRVSMYHIFEDLGDGKLKELKKVPGHNAGHALRSYLDSNKTSGKPFVVVPARNLTRVTVEVETKTQVTLKSA